MTCHTCHPATSAKQITQLFIINRKLILTLLKGDYQLIFFSHESYKKHVANVAVWQIPSFNA